MKNRKLCLTVLAVTVLLLAVGLALLVGCPGPKAAEAPSSVQPLTESAPPVVTAAAAQAADAVPDVVRAKRFELVDDTGKMRALLAMHPDGSPGLWLLDTAGKARGGLFVATDGRPTLSLYDAAGEPLAMLGVLPDGSWGLWLVDATGTPRAALGVRPNGTSGLALSDAAGEARALLATSADGSPDLQLRDAAGQVLWKAP